RLSFTPLALHSLLPLTPRPTAEPYTLSLHDALPISGPSGPTEPSVGTRFGGRAVSPTARGAVPGSRMSHFETLKTPYRTRIKLGDRKSTRLNSSHVKISYAVFCLKKKKQNSSKHDST